MQTITLTKKILTEFPFVSLRLLNSCILPYRDILNFLVQNTVSTLYRTVMERFINDPWVSSLFVDKSQKCMFLALLLLNLRIVLK